MSLKILVTPGSDYKYYLRRGPLTSFPRSACLSNCIAHNPPPGSCNAQPTDPVPRAQSTHEGDRAAGRMQSVVPPHLARATACSPAQ